MAKSYMKLDGNLVPISLDTVGTTSKEEQTKSVAAPNFSSGNVIVTPDTGKVLSQVTVVKDSDLTPENIKIGVTIFGITGTYEGEPNGFTLVFNTVGFFYDGGSIEYLKYSVNSGSTWVDIPINTTTVLYNVLTVQLKTKLPASNFRDYITINTTPDVGLQGNYGPGGMGGGPGTGTGTEEDITNNVTLTEDTVITLNYYND